jgi:hypothetical protein
MQRVTEVRQADAERHHHHRPDRVQGGVRQLVDLRLAVLAPGEHVKDAVYDEGTDGHLRQDREDHEGNVLSVHVTPVPWG